MDFILVAAMAFAVLLVAAIFWVKQRKAKLADQITELLNSSILADRFVEQKPGANQDCEADVSAEIVNDEKLEVSQNLASAVDEVEVAPVPVSMSAVASSLAAESPIPEDSTLRRHYLSTQRAEREAITNPYPTDSVLRRHYQSMTGLSPVLNVPTLASEAATPCAPRTLPEDSALRRHFLTQVRAEIAGLIGSRPTDSSLRRHYDARLEAEMERYLVGKN